MLGLIVFPLQACVPVVRQASVLRIAQSRERIISK